MNLKKLSVAAALSIGVMTISGIAIADQLGAICPPPRAMEQPCPIGAAAPVCPCPPQQVIPVQPIITGAACPVPVSPELREVFNPGLMPAPAAPSGPAGAAMSCQPITGCCPDKTAGAQVFERQAYAFPDIGDAGLVIPKGDGLLQIGGDEEALAVSSTCPSGLTAFPSYGPVINLISKDDPEFSSSYGPVGAAAPIGGCCPAGAAAPVSPCCPTGAAAPWAGAYPMTGAAAPVSGGCPVGNPCPDISNCPVNVVPKVSITQGVEILRPFIDEQATIISLYQNSPCFRESGILGAAVPINPCPAVPCNPCAPAAPIAPYPTGAAMPINPCDPCAPCPTGQAAPAYPISPCAPCNPCAPTGGAVPIIPANPCAPCDPCNPYMPAIPLSSVDTDDNFVPCANEGSEEGGEEGDEMSMAGEVPCDAFEPCPAAPVCPPPAPVCPEPCPQPAAPIYQAPCPTGMAVPMAPPIQGRKLQTTTGIQMNKSVLVPVQVPMTMTAPVGAACPVCPQFPDVGNATEPGCDVNKLAAQGILAGYPDRTYKPNVPIMRDEFASAMVSALELENVPDFAQQIFRDVPKNHWANADIDKAYNRGLVAGYPDCTFKPDRAVSRAEALSAMGKVIPGDISAADAQRILGCYTDANEIPGWAAMSVAEALNAGVIKNLPNSDKVQPNSSASRAEIASMIDELRQTLGLEPTPVTTGAATQLMPGIATSTIPTLKVQFEDIISARTSTVGDGFIAKTVEPVTIDGVLFPVGSEVKGEVVEVIRPGFGESGAIRVAFSEILFECEDVDDESDAQYTTALPRDILSAVVISEDNPNIIGRVLAWPFSWPGKVVGVAGRTVGGVVITASNMVEDTLTNIGNGTNELANLEAAAAGRSYLNAGSELAEGVYYTGKTAVSGTLGVVKVTGDEVAYLVSPDGERIAQINPDEVLSVAFGCQ